VLLLDEPLSALDALTRGTLQEEIERIWRQEQKTVVMITNHVDEAILLADRIVPLSPGPSATLGHSITVDLPRPRDARMANHSPEFQRLRAQVTEFLVEERRHQRSAVPVAMEPAVSPLRHAPIQLESRPRRNLQTADV
jgi:nitrate/nitrite transport system ATP-binding protein